nr:NAD(P)H:quinone oxidoreductase-like [Nicotiana tomentosiformis]
MDDDSDREWTEWFSVVATNSIIPTTASSFLTAWNRTRLPAGSVTVPEEDVLADPADTVRLLQEALTRTSISRPVLGAAVVEAFRKKIKEADCYCFASPEYNYSVTALKNAIDWGGRPPNVWDAKAAAIVSAGGGFGGGRSHYHLRHIGIYIDLHFVNKTEFFLNGFTSPKFGDEGVLTDEESKPRLREVGLIAIA